MKKIAVIGGGAAGMMAAIIAARNGADVTILEKNDRIGKKILATGNGKCNFSNTIMDATFFHSEDKEFPKQIVNQFSVVQTITFFEELGLGIKNKNGYLYPMSEQATAVLDVLRLEISRLSITVEKECVIEEIKEVAGKFLVKTKNGSEQFDAVIISTGGKAAPKTGSDGSGYVLAKKLGHTIIEPLPALVQLQCKETLFRGIAGVRMDAGVTLLVNGAKADYDRGEVQMTEYGLSGIPVFQISRTAAKELRLQKKVEVAIDFLPQISEEELQTFLEKRLEHNSYKTIEEFFYGIFPKKVITMLLKQEQVTASKQTHKIPYKQLYQMICSWKRFVVTVTKTNSFEQAQVCSGGVCVKELTNQMESKQKQGIYFAGELVDVDGKCGGYNLQWAWSSGYVAGISAAQS